jgi:hypothetical protein
MMKCGQLLAVFLLVLMVGCNMSGCGRGIFNTEPFTDMTKDEHGRSKIADTPRNWRDWREEIGFALEAEAAGKRANGGVTWNEFWLLRFRALERTQENAPKYIDYIIEARRRAGLPELEGYPPAADD